MIEITGNYVFSVKMAHAVVDFDISVGAVDISFDKNTPIKRTVELVPGTVLADYSANGELLHVEVLTGVPEGQADE